APSPMTTRTARYWPAGSEPPRQDVSAKANVPTSTRTSCGSSRSAKALRAASSRRDSRSFTQRSIWTLSSGSCQEAISRSTASRTASLAAWSSGASEWAKTCRRSKLSGECAHWLLRKTPWLSASRSAADATSAATSNAPAASRIPVLCCIVISSLARAAPGLRLHRHVALQVLQSRLFKARDLRLGDADLLCYLHLSPPVEEPHGQDEFLPFTELGHALPDGDPVHPDALFTVLVADLVHDVNGVAAVVVDGLKKGDGVLDGVQGVDHFFPGQPQLFGDLPDGRLRGILVHQGVPHLKRLVSDVPQRPAHPDGVVVPEVAADLSDDHGHGVRREADVLAQVEVVDGLHQADATHLKEVVDVLAPVVEPLDDAEDEPQVPLHQLGTGLLVALPHLLEQLAHAFVGQHGELGRVDTADLDLVQLHATPSSSLCNDSMAAAN